VTALSHGYDSVVSLGHNADVISVMITTILNYFRTDMVNAVVPMGDKPNTYGWLQLEKKAAQVSMGLHPIPAPNPAGRLAIRGLWVPLAFKKKGIGKRSASGRRRGPLWARRRRSVGVVGNPPGLSIRPP